MPRRKNEYTYIGDPILKIVQEQHAEFIINYQESILHALVERQLITTIQFEKCLKELRFQRKGASV